MLKAESEAYQLGRPVKYGRHQSRPDFRKRRWSFHVQSTVIGAQIVQIRVDPHKMG